MDDPKESLLKNCWEIKGCGRHVGGDKIEEIGECIVSKLNLGQACWTVTGSLCNGTVQDFVEYKEHECLKCDVYRIYKHLIWKGEKEGMETNKKSGNKFCEKLLNEFGKVDKF
ncbi:MAG: hypothetical protein OEM02_13135 [Desulfobulbaceae bacterium]|nr:hypothetical protein [Desulfobulbaceae bacterium]